MVEVVQNFNEFVKRLTDEKVHLNYCDTANNKVLTKMIKLLANSGKAKGCYTTTVVIH